jgi:hypothetical protein
MAFVCAEFHPPPEDMEGVDASLSIAMNVTGLFTDADNFTATVEMDVSCVGADCGMLADYGMDLPCSQTIEIAATFDSEGPVRCREAQWSPSRGPGGLAHLARG